MINKNNKAFSILYLLFGAILLFPITARADCTSPAAPAGIIEYFSASEQVFKYCNGTDWIPWGGNTPAGAIWSDSGSGYIEYSSTLGAMKVGSIISLPPPDGAAATGGGGGTPGGADTEIQFNSGGAFGGDPDLTWNVSSNTMNTINIDYTGYITDISDRRLKENITPLENSFEGIIALQGYSFTMKSDETATVEYGLMAQDVQTVFPALVKTHENGILSLNYIGLIAPLIETVKTQQRRIDSLETAHAAEINDLRSRLLALESRYGAGVGTEQDSTGGGAP